MWILIVGVDVIANGVNQIRNIMETAASEALLSELAKPTLNQIQPGTGGRGEVQMEAWMSRTTLARIIHECIKSEASEFSPRSGRTIIAQRFIAGSEKR